MKKPKSQSLSFFIFEFNRVKKIYSFNKIINNLLISWEICSNIRVAKSTKYCNVQDTLS